MGTDTWCSTTWLFASIVAMTVAPIGTKQAELITVNDPRPLAEAVRRFQDMYGFVVTYEDPRFTHPSDLVESSSSRSLVRQLIPRGGSFTARLETRLAPSAALAEVARAVQSIIDQYHATGYPGRFRVVEEDGILSVVPTAALGEDGSYLPSTSVLDTHVSLPAQKGRTMFAGVREVLAATAADSGHRINLGTFPTNLMMQTLMEDEARDVPAKDILLRAFRASGRDLSWRMLYAGDEKFYAFNVRIVNTGRRHEE